MNRNYTVLVQPQALPDYAAIALAGQVRSYAELLHTALRQKSTCWMQPADLSFAIEGTDSDCKSMWSLLPHVYPDHQQHDGTYKGHQESSRMER